MMKRNDEGDAFNRLEYVRDNIWLNIPHKINGLCVDAFDYHIIPNGSHTDMKYYQLKSKQIHICT